MDYLSFDLRLGDWNASAQSGAAEVLQSPAGQGTRYSFTLDTSVFAPGERVLRSTGRAAELGRILATQVLGPAMALWYESYQIARERDRGLRMRLHIESWELAQLPWELTLDVRRDDFLVFDPRVSLVRFIRLHAASPALRQAAQLKVMIVVASPTDQLPLDSPREIALLQHALADLVHQERIQIVICDHATHEKLHVALLEHRPDVVHYVGHAEFDRQTRQGFLALEDDAGHSDLVDAKRTARLLRRYGTNLVVLNACETAQGAWAGLSPSLVRADIPAVVSMQWPVEDRAAVAFSRSFYRALSMGRTIDECVAEARIGVSAVTDDVNDWAAPVLFLRSVSGQLWTRDVRQLKERLPLIDSPVPTDRAKPATPGESQSVFKTFGPLRSPDDDLVIIDRPELRRALSIAQQPSVTQYVAILGPRQTGKTTLLFRIHDLLRGHYGCVFVDLSILHAQDARACFRFLAFQMLGDLRTLLGDSFSLPDRFQIDSAVDFLAFLRELAEIVPLPRIIVLLDEVGALSPDVSDTFYNTLRTVFTQGRGMADALSKFLFVFSGAVDLYDLTFGTISPLNICEKIYLHDLDLEDVGHILKVFEARLDTKVCKDAADRLFALTEGHPYLTMKICSSLEQRNATKITAKSIDEEAAKLLLEDDNIRYLLRKLEASPREQKRLREILIDKRQVPFSRNDPGLAALEMMGAIRAVQPARIRNALYDQALRAYFEQHTPTSPMVADDDVALATFHRLQDLRQEALAVCGTNLFGREWERYAAALFSMISALSVHPQPYADADDHDLLFAVTAQSGTATFWADYQPAVLVACREAQDIADGNTLGALAVAAERHHVRLAFVLTQLDAQDDRAAAFTYSGQVGDVCLVVLDDSEIAELLATQGKLDDLLHQRVLAAQQRRLV